MTPEERDKLIKVETQMEDIKDDISEIKKTTTNIFDRLNLLQCQGHAEQIKSVHKRISGLQIVLGLILSSIIGLSFAIVQWGVLK